MKTSELRIGNKVYIVDDESDEPKQFYTIDKSAFDLVDCLEPIPLTPEILLKLGFENKWGDKWGCKDVEIELAIRGYMLLNGEEQFAWNKVYLYVHELQNLYFALTGEELTVPI